ncbi:MAG: hypothetical protein JO224_12420 [Pelomonas sp.]|nr:hypothetical protein [Roseateles sp.]
MKPWFGLSLVCLSIFAAPAAHATRYEVDADGLVFSIDDTTGAYAVDAGELHFGGRVLRRTTTVTAVDGALHFLLGQGLEASVAPAPGGARALLFSWRVVDADASGRTTFPDFTDIPAGLHSMSHQQLNFAPPIFDAAQDVATPWLLFNEAGPALIVSPASDFFLASMHGDARTRVAVGLNPEVHTLAPGFTASSLVAAGPGVGSAYAAWGQALRALYGRKPAAPDADATLRSLGELTDNAGGHYYYHYDDGLNYEDSLVRFVERSRKAGIPFGYLQLDSWWYSKSAWNPHEQIGRIKNPALPDQDWNRYGGLLVWRAHPGVFPKGMAAFHERVQLPFLAHNRFIDKDSPYRERYRISGVAAVDPGYWEELATYAASNGIAVYLQDWLDATYKYSPELHSAPGLGDAFLGGMAKAMQAHGLTMQYCMAYPLHMLQGVEYPNLTTIRAAVDGLTRDRWTQLAFNARFIHELGAWPATDVFPSGDAAAMRFAVLSGGPVGVGDGFEGLDKANIFKAVRADGVIVKPDAPLSPLDRSYLSQATRSGAPIVAAAFTRHEAGATAYLLAFADAPGKGATGFAIAPAELGFGDGRVAVLDPETGALALADAQTAIQGGVAGPTASAYRIVAPVSAAGIAVFGDLGKFAAMGRTRVAAYQIVDGAARLTLAFTAKETELAVSGYAASGVSAKAEGAEVTAVDRDAATGLFTVHLRRPGGAGGTVALVLASR